MIESELVTKVLALAKGNVAQGGGPFAALVVKDGEIIGVGVNQVTHNFDPTAHAEILAIRNACQRIKSHQLSGCVLYSSCEPCPMCFGAIYWSRLNSVIYVASRQDAASAGFDDSLIYSEITLADSERGIAFRQYSHANAIEPFECWCHLPSKKSY